MSQANFANRTLYRNDNLLILRGLNSASVDLIATDPPFNKGRDFHATPESLVAGAKFQDRWSWERDVHETWIDKIADDWPGLKSVIEAARIAHSDGMGAFVCFMAVRLIEMHRVLKPTGSLYLHCDATAAHYLKGALDSIFGDACFRNEIVWRIGWVSGYKTQKRGFIRNHDKILYYVKDAKNFTFNKEVLPYPPGYLRRDGKQPKGSGVPLEDTWNCNRADTLDSIMIKSFSNEKTGYPTQKPVDLYKRIIKASSNGRNGDGSHKGDIVLDPFCGCATTLVAAEALGRQWLGIDIWKGTRKQVMSRMKGEVGMFGDVNYQTRPPRRTDGGQEAIANLRVIMRTATPPASMTRAQMVEALVKQDGMRCQGCNRDFDDIRYLELDHIKPRADGGSNELDNRILLCSPCNRAKGHALTLSGLRQKNKKEKFMKGA